MTRRHSGVTLLEVLVAVAIVAVLVGLLLPAVQNARQAAGRLASANKLRQLSLASHMLEDRYGGRPAVIKEQLPLKPGSTPPILVMYDLSYTNGGQPVIAALAYEADPGYKNRPFRTSQSDFEYTGQLHQSVGDASLSYEHLHGASWSEEYPDGTRGEGRTKGNCSFVVNAQAVKSRLPMSAAMPDGLSNTIYLAEQYARTVHTMSMFAEIGGEGFYMTSAPWVVGRYRLYQTFRRATFADELCGDVYPVTTGTPAVTTGRFIPQQSTVTSETMFQCAVPPAQATGKVPYSPYPGGLQVGMADGSVRMIRAGTDPSVFWGSVTPAGGEVGNLD